MIKKVLAKLTPVEGYTFQSPMQRVLVALTFIQDPPKKKKKKKKLELVIVLFSCVCLPFLHIYFPHKCFSGASQMVIVMSLL